jgi:hypothetical protein
MIKVLKKPWFQEETVLTCTKIVSVEANPILVLRESFVKSVVASGEWRTPESDDVQTSSKEELSDLELVAAERGADESEEQQILEIGESISHLVLVPRHCIYEEDNKEQFSDEQEMNQSIEITNEGFFVEKIQTEIP